MPPSFPSNNNGSNNSNEPKPSTPFGATPDMNNGGPISNPINKIDNVASQGQNGENIPQNNVPKNDTPQTMRDFYDQNKNQFVNYGASSSANGSTNIPTMNKSPFTPRSQNISETTVPHKKSPLVSLIVLVVVLAIAGLAYAYKDTIMDKFVSKAPFSAGNMFSVIRNASKGLEKATYTMNLKISGSESTSVNTGEDTNGLQNSPLALVSLLPSTFKLDTTITGNTAKNEKGSINSKFNVTGMVDFGSLKADLSLSYIMIDKDMYINIDKIPQILGDTTAIQGKWIHINAKDLGSRYGLSTNNNKNIDSPEYKKSNELLISLLDKNNVVSIIGSPVREKVGEFSTYRYDLTLNEQGVTQFLKDVEQNKDTILFTQEMRDSFDRFIKTQDQTQISKVIEYIKKNATVMVWVTKEGAPVKMKLSFKLETPQVRNTKGKQFTFDFTVTLSDLNKATNITAPSSYLEEDDAYSLITGKSKDLIAFEKNSAQLSSIYFSLASEFTKNKRYPDVLPESLKSDFIKSYTVVNNGTDFKLIYEVNFPKYSKDNDNYYVIKRVYGSGSLPTYGLYMVNGTNTMNSRSNSLEADIQNKIDSDKDGLPDALEKYIGTNPLKKDTNIKL